MTNDWAAHAATLSAAAGPTPTSAPTGRPPF